MPPMIIRSPKYDPIVKWSLKTKYPVATVRIKLIPTATGMINVKLPVESALNNTRADRKIMANANMICTWNRNLIQSLNTTSVRPFRLYLMIAAPLTFSKAYKKQNMMALNTVN